MNAIQTCNLEDIKNYESFCKVFERDIDFSCCFSDKIKDGVLLYRGKRLNKEFNLTKTITGQTKVSQLTEAKSCSCTISINNCNLKLQEDIKFKEGDRVAFRLYSSEHFVQLKSENLIYDLEIPGDLAERCLPRKIIKSDTGETIVVDEILQNKKRGFFDDLPKFPTSIIQDGLKDFRELKNFLYIKAQEHLKNNKPFNVTKLIEESIKEQSEKLAFLGLIALERYNIKDKLQVIEKEAKTWSLIYESVYSILENNKPCSQTT